MVVGAFMAVLDIQIVSSSLTQIQAGLSASAAEVSWVQTSYLIAEVVMIPLCGYLTRMWSTRVVYTACAAGFTLASVMCGLATTLEEMMVWRAIQGFLGGAMIPTTFATSYLIFGTQRRGMAGAFMGLTITLAPTIGPTLGGYITSWFSWHWLFFVNVIPGIAVTSLVWTFMHIDKPNLRLWKNFDFAGLALLAIFLGTFQYVLEEGAKNEWFRDAEIRNLAAVSLIAGALFFWRTLTREDPLVDLSPFANRTFALATIGAFIVGVGLFGITYLLPLYLGRVQQFSSMEIGQYLWVTGLFMFMTAPTTGMLANRIDLRYIAAFGFLMLIGSAYFLTELTAESDFWNIFVPQAMRGVGLMCTMMGVQTIAIQALRPDQVKGASGLFNLMRNTGGAFGLAVLNTQLTDRINVHWWQLRESLQAGDPQATAFLEGFAARYGSMYAGDADTAALKILGHLTFQQSSIMAFNDLFLILAFIFAGALILVPVLGKPVNNLSNPPPAEAH
ncbi:MAG: DHA2 family efflux MFS transporter permease subunit [Alphaproteobacteria bacterium]|nr:DHA2 family efflux MFS transporter permease subunit [Alphaproteobacteria bacterium]